VLHYFLGAPRIIYCTHLTNVLRKCLSISAKADVNASTFGNAEFHDMLVSIYVIHFLVIKCGFVYCAKEERCEDYSILGYSAL
jgi:hypothetical protein